MGDVFARITVSVGGFITGPGAGPGCGLGVGGERLHYWVFGGPWSYDSPERGEPATADKALLEETLGSNGRGDRGSRHLRCDRVATGQWTARTPRASRCWWSLTAPQGSPSGGADLIRKALAARRAGEEQ